MDKKLCQSCGMPLTEDVLGTNANEQYYHSYPRSFVIE